MTICHSRDTHIADTKTRKHTQPHLQSSRLHRIQHWVWGGDSCTPDQAVKKSTQARVRLACAHSNLCANTFRPHPLPPTHPNLTAGFSVFPFRCFQQPILLFPDLVSAQSHPLPALFPHMLTEVKLTASGATANLGRVTFFFYTSCLPCYKSYIYWQDRIQCICLE